MDHKVQDPAELVNGFSKKAEYFWYIKVMIMVLMRTESTLYITNSSFGETINKFQDCNIKKNLDP